MTNGGRATSLYVGKVFKSCEIVESGGTGRGIRDQTAMDKFPEW